MFSFLTEPTLLPSDAGPLRAFADLWLEAIGYTGADSSGSPGFDRCAALPVAAAVQVGGTWKLKAPISLCPADHVSRITEYSIPRPRHGLA